MLRVSDDRQGVSPWHRPNVPPAPAGDELGSEPAYINFTGALPERVRDDPSGSVPHEAGDPRFIDSQRERFALKQLRTVRRAARGVLRVARPGERARQGQDQGLLSKIRWVPGASSYAA